MIKITKNNISKLSEYFKQGHKFIVWKGKGRMKGKLYLDIIGFVEDDNDYLAEKNYDLNEEHLKDSSAIEGEPMDLKGNLVAYNIYLLENDKEEQLWKNKLIVGSL